MMSLAEGFDYDDDGCYDDFIDVDEMCALELQRNAHHGKNQYSKINPCHYRLCYIMDHHNDTFIFICHNYKDGYHYGYRFDNRKWDWVEYKLKHSHIKKQKCFYRRRRYM